MMDKTQRRQSLVVSILILVFFVISAFTFMNMFYGFVDVIGSIVSGSVDVALKDLTRSIPLFLVFFMSLWTLLLLQASFRKVNDEKWRKSLTKDAYCIIGFAVVNIIFVIVGLIIGKFSSLVEGSPTAIYPLDTFLLSFLFIALGLFVIFYLKKFEKDHPYISEGHNQIVTKARGAYCTFVTFWMLFALFGFAASMYGLFIYDFKHEFAFYGVATILCYFLSPLFLGVWEFYYNELKEEKKKEFLLPLAICGLVVAILMVAIYMIALASNLDAPSNFGFGTLPIAFTASVNIATLVVVFTPVIVSVTALIKGLLKRKAAKASSEEEKPQE